MPSSAASCPSSSTVSETRTPIDFSSTNHSTSADDEHERAHRKHPDELGPEVAARRDADRERAPHAGEEVCGHRADDVIQLQALHQLHAGGADDAADGADDDRPVVIDDVRAGP